MAKKSLADILYYDSERDYDVRRGDVMYLDDKPLKRKKSPGTAGKIFILAVVIVAAVLGGIFINDTLLAPIREAENIQTQTAENLKRPSGLETLPIVPSLINLDDAGIIQAFADAGYEWYDMTEANGGTLTIFKLPDDVPLAEGEALLVRGINSLNSAQASKSLQGSWRFSADRVGGTSMVARYVDFSTGTPEVALQNALAKEGIDPNTQTESGTDDHGNTYILGNMEVDGVPCTWRISALPLSEIYEVSGLPEKAVYVGVRVSK